MKLKQVKFPIEGEKYLALRTQRSCRTPSINVFDFDNLTKTTLTKIPKKIYSNFESKLVWNRAPD